MQIWPAIDLRGGKCVRLEQGDYDRETVFGDDPVAMARHWVSEGARFLHLVDLDGAARRPPHEPSQHSRHRGRGRRPLRTGGRHPRRANCPRIARSGPRSPGAWHPRTARARLVSRPVSQIPRPAGPGARLRDGRVATDGWLETSHVRATELAQQFAAEPLAAIIYTDIATDGMLCGPNLSALRNARRGRPAGHCLGRHSRG